MDLSGDLFNSSFWLGGAREHCSNRTLSKIIREDVTGEVVSNNST